MKQIRQHVAGLDVHRDTVVTCCRVNEPDGSLSIAKESFSTTSLGLRKLAGFLTEHSVKTVAMEATGVYWKPIYYALEPLFEEVWLCNAQHVKNVPGRKTDLSDAEWLADVAAHGMVRPSFVPPPKIRELRDLTRYRKTQVDARVREIQRLEKVLQDACIKLTSVASGVWSKSSKEIIEAMIAGERDPKILAELAKSRLRSKITKLTEALDGHFSEHHGDLCRQIIHQIESIDETISNLTETIAEKFIPFEPQLEVLSSIPGVSVITAEVIIAETGGNMKQFPTAEHLCAWAGVAPASYESAGKHKPVHTRHGAPNLKRALVEAARTAARTKNTYFSAQYSRIARRRGPNKAAMAVAHSILSVSWHLLTTGQIYEDPGSDYFTLILDPKREAKRLTSKIEQLGYEVTLTKIPA